MSKHFSAKCNQEKIERLQKKNYASYKNLSKEEK